ncbi:DUF305 domain-containing protein [Microbacterium sp. NPDC056003]|uniref:DUF305 domain-containing protein n=1 Tax=Microbacterium sp. NPDC056003 TaxID=3345676 RepID=UPI0035E1BBBF
MRRLRTIALTSSALLATALVLAGCAPQDGTMPGMDHGPGGMTATTEPAAEFNAADEMFVTMMIPHHQQAIDMADIVLAKTDVAPQVTALAQQIKDAQGPEIETMRGWLQDWGVDYDDSMGGMGHGDGMMSDDDMTALEDASGPEAGRLFLEQMIVHHQGAIEMAEMALESAQNPDVTALATQVIEDQTAEIATMQDLLATL